MKGHKLGTVDSKDFSIFQKLKARLELLPKFGNLYLGYCVVHKTYFLDVMHTNNVIRCPTCDTIWLNKHMG